MNLSESKQPRIARGYLQAVENATNPATRLVATAENRRKM